jgi:hypothetical protein
VGLQDLLEAGLLVGAEVQARGEALLEEGLGRGARSDQGRQGGEEGKEGIHGVLLGRAVHRNR